MIHSTSDQTVPITSQIINPSSHIEVPFQVVDQYEQLKTNFNKIVFHTRVALRESNINIDDLQQPLRDDYGLEPLRNVEADLEMIWDRISKQYSLLDIDILELLVNVFLSDKARLCQELSAYNDQIEMFKTSAQMKHLEIGRAHVGTPVT